MIWKADGTLSAPKQWSVVYERSTALVIPQEWWRTERCRPVIQDGEPAWQVELYSGDLDHWNPDAERTELSRYLPFSEEPVDRLQREGEERWLTYGIWIPEDWPVLHPSQWCVVQQNKGVRVSGNGPLAMHFENGCFRLTQSADRAEGTTSLRSLWWSPEGLDSFRGKWAWFCLGVFWSTFDDGWVELWGDLRDGNGWQQLLAPVRRWTLKDGPLGEALTVDSRVGIYRKGGVYPTTALRYARFALHASRSEAEAWLNPNPEVQP